MNKPGRLNALALLATLASMATGCGPSKQEVALEAQRQLLEQEILVNLEKEEKFYREMAASVTIELSKQKERLAGYQREVELVRLDLAMRQEGHGKEADRILREVIRNGHGDITNDAIGILNMRRSVTNVASLYK